MASPGQNNNGTVAETLKPILRGHLQFLTVGLVNLQLDIVGFLAILGEGSLLATSQVSTLSKVTYLPRLLPAPQALLKPSRPSKLAPNPGSVTGVHSGNHKDFINHVGDVLVDIDSMPDYAVRCVQIIRKRDKPEVKARFVGPLTAVAVFGCLESVGLLIAACLYRDGMAIVATILLSSLSTLIGVGNKWKLMLPKRKQQNSGHIPSGDVVIRHPKGSFLVVQCVEDVARELYFAPENIDYLVSRPWVYRMISLVGTLMLMFGVIFLGNASTPLQIAFAAAYMLLNAAYWIVAALPAKSHWDMSSFTVKPQTFSKFNCDPLKKENGSYNKKYINHNESFTWALWKVIIATKSSGWVTLSKAAPITPAWEQWLREAVDQALLVTSSTEIDPKTKQEITVWEVPDWNPQEAFQNVTIELREAEKMV